MLNSKLYRKRNRLNQKFASVCNRFISVIAASMLFFDAPTLQNYDFSIIANQKYVDFSGE